MSDHEAPSTNPLSALVAGISPKVLWPLVGGAVLTFLGTTLAAVTPETLTSLGPWAVPVAMGATAVAGYFTGYLKRDPVRDAGKEIEQVAKAAGGPPAQSQG
ncbi:hypothetical protein SEA_WHEELBITE_71 [Arthrobacter phage Wheelbite]|uniref:Uncharacterized protein n=1 Tax=Arthrobacter phage Wheelbite TaxID=2015873 RepID=A0A222ZIJ2_9CAUD|nr:hypothetical protein KMD23_gp71 [Arthrobacter phage Wheelbite]ASR84159.1 hypothetical protein SEA_WHEELBITE_71 [Arthrobacter phage Wheelbite]